MALIFQLVKDYFQTVNRRLLLLSSAWVALLIGLNYSLHLEYKLQQISSPFLRLGGFFLLYLIVFGFATCLVWRILQPSLRDRKFLILLLLLAPALFACKIGVHQIASPLTAFLQEPWRRYWTLVLDWPLRFLLLMAALFLIWKAGRYQEPLAGWQKMHGSWLPYAGILLLMVPLIMLAASRPEFLRMYPRLQHISFLYPHIGARWPWQLLYEISYGSDFLTIETFFRGFLVLALARYLGRDAVLPVAVFYCSVHFGKPLFECISSFPGGLILGIIVQRSRSIWGGLMVHLGIAWLMEIAGLLAHAGLF